MFHCYQSKPDSREIREKNTRLQNYCFLQSEIRWVCVTFTLWWIWYEDTHGSGTKQVVKSPTETGIAPVSYVTISSHVQTHKRGDMRQLRMFIRPWGEGCRCWIPVNEVCERAPASQMIHLGHRSDASTRVWRLYNRVENSHMAWHRRPPRSG